MVSIKTMKLKSTLYNKTQVVYNNQKMHKWHHFILGWQKYRSLPISNMQVFEVGNSYVIALRVKIRICKL